MSPRSKRNDQLTRSRRKPHHLALKAWFQPTSCITKHQHTHECTRRETVIHRNHFQLRKQRTSNPKVELHQMCNRQECFFTCSREVKTEGLRRGNSSEADNQLREIVQEMTSGKTCFGGWDLMMEMSVFSSSSSDEEVSSIPMVCCLCTSGGPGIKDHENNRRDARV